MQKYQTQLVLGILVVLVLLSSIALSTSQKTGAIIGIPSTCKSKITLTAQNSLEISPSEMASIPAKVKSVLCGVSYVRLRLEGMPSELFYVSPPAIAVLSPGKEGEYTITFDIPDNAPPKTYAGIYTVYTNEGIFTFGELSVNIVEPSKPRAMVEFVSKPAVEVGDRNRNFWYAVGILSAVFAILLVSYEYFAVSKGRARKEALKRPEGSIYKALGVSPVKKQEFEKVLRKSKKRR